MALRRRAAPLATALMFAFQITAAAPAAFDVTRCSACRAVAVGAPADRRRALDAHRAQPPPAHPRRHPLTAASPPPPRRRRLTAAAFPQGVLAARLTAERPRNALDVRHRLDAAGNRYGKIIDFAVSELRALELLEGLCDAGLDTFSLAADGRWAAGAAGAAAGDAAAVHREKEDRKRLRHACADLVERWEDALSAALREGRLDAANASDYVCERVGGYCAEGEGAAAAAAEAAAAAAAAAAAPAAEAADGAAEGAPRAADEL
jgi:hypothetical protein